MRKFGLVFLLVGVGIFLTAYTSFSDQSVLNSQSADTLKYPQEKHFANVKQLTFGGDNAEAYWSFNSKMLSFQSNNKAWGLSCDQIFYTPVNKKVDLKNN
ncbi:MAG TPA: hypothetical protein VGK39_07385, partial [Cyclobacteriaceae bacterium]